MLDTRDVQPFFDEAKPVVFALIAPLAIFMIASFLPAIGEVHLGVFVAIVGCVVTFFSLNPVQSVIEDLPYGPAQVCVSFPFTLLMLGWMTALVFLGRTDSITMIVPGFLLAVITAIWPIFLKSREQEVRKRRLNYATSAVIATSVYLTLIITGGLS